MSMLVVNRLPEDYLARDKQPMQTQPGERTQAGHQACMWIQKAAASCLASKMEHAPLEVVVLRVVRLAGCAEGA